MVSQIIPNFTTNVVSNFSLNGGAVFGTAALIGKANWGLPEVVQNFSSFVELKDYYKAGEIVDAASLFFKGGGNSLKVSRIAGTAKKKATKNFQNTAVDVLQIDALYEGIYGNNIAVTITANAVNANNRDVLIGDGVVEETYLDLASNDLIVAALLSSNLVRATKLTNALVDATTKTFLLLGNDGNTLSTTEYLNLYNSKLLTEDFDYLNVIGQTSDAFHSTFASLMDTRASTESKYSIYITGVDKFESISTTKTRTAVGTSGRIVTIHTALYDEVGDKLNTSSWKDASYSAMIFTGKLCNLPVNSSPTYKSLAMIGGKTLANNSYTRSEKNELADSGFIVIDTTISGVYGAIMTVTRNNSTTTWNYMLDNMRKVDYMTTNVYLLSIPYIGLPNDSVTRKSIKMTATGFLIGVKRDRIIENYQVEVLKGIDPRQVNINVSVLLITELDYINFTIILNV